MTKDPFVFIHHIYDAISDIEEYKSDTPTFKDLQADKKTQDAIVRKLEIVGEAINNLPLEFRGKYPEVDWKGPVNVRNIISHEYFDLDLDIVWKLFDRDIPIFKSQMEEILKSEPHE